jgi:hypothetical protein
MIKPSAKKNAIIIGIKTGKALSRNGRSYFFDRKNRTKPFKKISITNNKYLIVSSIYSITVLHSLSGKLSNYIPTKTLSWRKFAHLSQDQVPLLRGGAAGGVAAGVCLTGERTHPCPLSRGESHEAVASHINGY